MSGDRRAFGLLAAGTAAGFAASLVLGAVAFTRPDGGDAYRQQVELGYGADADPDVYDGGRVSTGDPVFLQVVRRFDVEVTYRLAGDDVADVAGRMSLAVRVTSATGWQRTIEVAEPRPFVGPQVHLSASVVPGALRKVIRETQQRTGSLGDDVRLHLVPRVEAAATIGGRRVDLRYEPDVTFSFRTTQVVLDDGLEHERGRPIVRSAVSELSPATLGLLGFEPRVDRARLLSPALALAALVPAAVRLLRRRRRGRDPDVVDRRGRHPIDVRRADVQGPAVDVAELADLLELADRLDRPVLRTWADHGSATYLVQDGGTTYRFAGGTAWPLPDPLIKPVAIPRPTLAGPASPGPASPGPASPEPAIPEPAIPEPAIPEAGPRPAAHRARHLETGDADRPRPIPRQRRRGPSHRSPSTVPEPAEAVEHVLTQDGVDQLRRWLRA
jgi:hypothetical protein